MCVPVCAPVLCARALGQTDFKGKVYMTHPTKSVYKLILQDYVKVRCTRRTRRNSARVSLSRAAPALHHWRHAACWRARRSRSVSRRPGRSHLPEATLRACPLPSPFACCMRCGSTPNCLLDCCPRADPPSPLCACVYTRAAPCLWRRLCSRSRTCSSRWRRSRPSTTTRWCTTRVRTPPAHRSVPLCSFSSLFSLPRSLARPF